MLAIHILILFLRHVEQDFALIIQAVSEIAIRSNMWGRKGPHFSSPLQVAKKVYHALFGEKSKRVYKILAPFQK